MLINAENKVKSKAKAKVAALSILCVSSNAVTYQVENNFVTKHELGAISYMTN